MAYQPFDRNPSGIVFFGTAATDKLYDSTSTFTYDVGNNALKIPNGGYIGSQNTFNSISIASNGNVTFAQNLSVGGNLTVNGTTTTVNSTVVTIQDPIIVLGSGSPNADDNKDRGIAFNFHTGSVAKSGFFGYDDSTGGFTFIPDATFSSEVISGTAGWATFAGVSGDLSGNATTATTLQNTRTFAVSGETLAAAQNFNGGANVTLTTALDKSAISNQVALSAVDGTNDFLLIYDASANGGTGGLAKINRTNFASGLGSMTSFIVSDGSNTQTINDGESLFFRSGPAISFTVSATDQVSGTLNAGVAGNGLNMTSQVLAVGAGSGITVGADQISVNAGSGLVALSDGLHLAINEYALQSVSSGNSYLTLLDDGITHKRTTQVALAAFLGNSPTGALIGNNGKLEVITDNSTIEIGGNSLRVKDSGIYEQKRWRTISFQDSNEPAFSDINLCTGGAGGITQTLFDNPRAGQITRYKKIDSGAGTVTIQRAGSSLIDGATSVVLYHQYESITLVYDGTNWHII